ncbi:substrate-binding domain-containing protein [Saccharopolyspora griseoalba]|uniref:Substrate-binding domain-containing protein n=1 Tax=Saccharopolyspora griseoalba TaxID=1431848 RepID=A0ABW2LKN2_9PSEU
MSGIPWELVLAIIGVLVPIAAFLWEFAVVGRKRLGYRVQMDTTPTDVSPAHAGAWRRLERESGERLVDPSFALLRIENVASAPITESDYSAPANTEVGLWARFPGRRVTGVVVTELSDPALGRYFADDAPGLGMRDTQEGAVTVGIVELPKVKLNPGAHYKVLVVLERAGDNDLQFPEPEVVGTVSGGGDGKILKTKGQTGTPRWVVALVCFLLMIGLAEPFLFEVTGDDPAPLDCASGELTVVGSTAFRSVLREAGESYRDSCPEAEIELRLDNSHQGLRALDESGERGVLAFSDGPKGDRMPALVPRPVALLLFTVVIHPDTGVHDLTSAELREVFAGEISNWRELGGNDLPVRIVDREAASGTRATFEERVLGGVKEPGENTEDCVSAPRGEVARCRRDGTDELLGAVAQTPGAIGYAELKAAQGRGEVQLVRVDGQAASAKAAEAGAYPFWQTEYAYTRGVPAADSLPMSFLRFLTNQRGADIIRSHGNTPCQDLRNPVTCRPEPAP